MSYCDFANALPANTDNPNKHYHDHQYGFPIADDNALFGRLFAGLSSLFSRHDLNILAARAYVTEHNFILDTFIVQMPAQCLPHDYRRIQTRLEAALDDFVHNRNPPEIAQPAPPQSRRSRHLPIAPRINIYSEDDAGWYVLEIITFNRRYLLANIAGNADAVSAGL